MGHVSTCEQNLGAWWGVLFVIAGTFGWFLDWGREGKKIFRPGGCCLRGAIGRLFFLWGICETSLQSETFLAIDRSEARPCDGGSTFLC